LTGDCGFNAAIHAYRATMGGDAGQAQEALKKLMLETHAAEFLFPDNSEVARIAERIHSHIFDSQAFIRSPQSNEGEWHAGRASLLRQIPIKLEI
jgi:hypothetical protein